jgi:large subunit ribosomal protein L7/L12
MGIFGSSSDQSPQDQIDLDHVNDRLAKLESALASLQAQVALLTTGAVGAGAASPMAGSDGNNVAGGAWMDEVRRLKDSDQLISAIKLYRENTGVGLKEAKDIVEGMI